MSNNFVDMGIQLSAVRIFNDLIQNIDIYKVSDLLKAFDTLHHNTLVSNLKISLYWYKMH